MKTLHAPHPDFTLPAAGFLGHWIATLRARLQRQPADDYPLTASALRDMGLNASDLMAIRSGLFDRDGTRRGRQAIDAPPPESTTGGDAPARSSPPAARARQADG